MRALFDAADKVAIGLSALCTIHCLVLPILLIILPSVSLLMALSNEAFHFWLVFAVIPISLFAVVTGYYHHKTLSVGVISIFGIFMLILAATIGHDVFGELGEVALTVIGSIIIAFGHFQNLRLRQKKVAVLNHA